MATQYTRWLKLAKPEFDRIPWHDFVNGNMDILDAILGDLGIFANFRGLWQPSTDYVEDDRVVDPVTGDPWQVAVTHTSGSGTFAEDRAAHPTYWEQVEAGVVVRGQHVLGTSYVVGDFVYDTAEYLGGIVKTAFVGGSTLRDNIANIGIIFDLKPTVLGVDAQVGIAQGHANSANNSQLAAQGFATTAQNAAGDASDFADAAEGFKNDAQSASGIAVSASGTAVSARDAALGAKDAALLAQGAAENAQIASENARDLAQEWAENPEDTSVVVGKYSALHWAAKSEEHAISAKDEADRAEAAAISLKLSSFPLGAVIMQNGPVDPGFLRFGEGGSYDRATYPDLAAWMDANGETAFGLSAGDVAAGVLPDWRDYVPRTAGGALGPAVGGKQLDAFQGHTFAPNTRTGLNGNYGAIESAGDTSTDRQSVPFSEFGLPVSDGTNGTPRTATETRVKSFGVRWQIKAYGALVNQGTADLVAIEQAYADMQTLVGNLPFQDEYVSVEQAITSGGSLTLSHGLPSAPKLVQAELVCVSAEAGYSVGERVSIDSFNYSPGTTAALGVSFRKTASEISLYYGSSSNPFIIRNKTNSGSSSITNSSWRLKVRAWA